MNNVAKIAGVYYPKKKLLYQGEHRIKYYFKLMDKSIEFELKGHSRYSFLEHNSRSELILRTNSYSLRITNKQTSIIDKFFSYKDHNVEFKSDKKINKFFSLKNKRYIVSVSDVYEKHYIILLNKNLDILNENKVGYCPWHSQNAIDEANGVVMYAEYNVSIKSRPVSIYRSKDNGTTWQSVFVLNAPEELRHFHTLQSIKNSPGFWLATTGDTPAQSRWFLSKNDGDTWHEITDTTYINDTYIGRSKSAHRTTAIDISDEYYCWSTDDLMGNVQSYFLCENGERKSF